MTFNSNEQTDSSDSSDKISWLFQYFRSQAFTDRNEEVLFQRHYALIAQKSVRLAAIVTAIIVLAFSRVDFLSYGEKWFIPFSVRIAVPVLFCCIMIWFTYNKNFLKSSQLITSILLIVVLISTYVVSLMISVGPISVMNHQIVVLNTVMAWIFAGIGFNLLARHTFIVVLLPSILVLVTIGQVHQIHQQYFEGYIASLTGTILFTYMVAFQRERHVREMYILQRDLESKVESRTKLLQAEVAGREGAERFITHQSNFDQLTGLVNRHLFPDRLKDALSRAERSNHGIALLHINLNKFKQVNEAMGYLTGDQLLIEASNRLRNCLRKSDTVARTGSDEFAVIVSDFGAFYNIDDIAVNILDKFSQPYEIEGNRFIVTASIGITVFPEDGNEVDTLVRNANQAIERAKQLGENDYQFFTVEMEEKSRIRRELKLDLHKALINNEFFVCFQPIVDLAMNSISGCEALIRWQHPTRGLVSPVDFIPLAEETGLINPIGEWVLREACNEAVKWPLVNGKTITVAVNLSSPQFKSGDINSIVRNSLAESNLPANRLTLEITEGLLLNDDKRTLKQLKELRDSGVSIAIDDFGTGFSSLGYLKKFPIDILKIDRTFIMELPKNEDDEALVEAMIFIAKSLNLKVVAEGVETGEQAKFLATKNCAFAQGYLYSKPLVKTDFVSYLKNNLATKAHPYQTLSS